MKKNKIMNFIELQKKFPDENAVIAHFVALRYGGFPGCHHCGSTHVYHRKDKPKKFECMDCFNSFSVFKGTIFENSSTDLVKWMYAIHLFLNGKKGISGLQLMREVGVTYKTAWRMLRQIRLAMASDANKALFTNIVEMDETFMGGAHRKPNNQMKFYRHKKDGGKGAKPKTPVIGVFDRENKQVHVEVSKEPNVTGKELLEILQKVVEKGSTLVTDAYRGYRGATKLGYIHLYVDHTLFFSQNGIHNNGIESFWSTLKRGIYGIYHQVSPKYLQQYVNEFVFRYNNRGNKDVFDLLLMKTIGK